ncbi:uncharacterized protein CDAR_173791 [Caerostris darwini]|uniref:Uncharacterized protein n=1 Tax=Caerostris darwini TaxID=1538125 RepID=A0AAV4VGS8_9ARAC|nr:uncharacterized protein CDAR_173791 [Caerostris darwini]
MYLAKFLNLTFVFGTLISIGRVHSSNIFHRIEVRSHVCGVHPLQQFAEYIPDENKARHSKSELSRDHLERVFNFLKETVGIDEEVKRIMELYDDCIKTADSKYKKSPPELNEAFSSFYKKVIEALQ